MLLLSLFLGLPLTLFGTVLGTTMKCDSCSASCSCIEDKAINLLQTFLGDQEGVSLQAAYYACMKEPEFDAFRKAFQCAWSITGCETTISSCSRVHDFFGSNAAQYRKAHKRSIRSRPTSMQDLKKCLVRHGVDKRLMNISMSTLRWLNIPIKQCLIENCYHDRKEQIPLLATEIVRCFVNSGINDHHELMGLMRWN